MYLGIEIGGTKLQLGVGAGDGSPLAALERFEVEPDRGAAGILARIETVAGELVARHGVTAVGIGFGGPVDCRHGRTIKSHQIDGWDDFPLVAWCRETLRLPARLENDCDAAALAEASFGAGRGEPVVFYVTVGTGIGGGLVIDGKLYRGHGTGAAEIGHLRPGFHAQRPSQTVESLASGLGIAAAARTRLNPGPTGAVIPLAAGMSRRGHEAAARQLADAEDSHGAAVAELLALCKHHPERLTAKLVAQAAADGNELARDVLAQACQALGWGIAQMITLTAPSVVVVGGGVSLIGEALFFAPLRQEVERYVFPPFAGSYCIVPAELGETVVVHGALAAARDAT